jgi:hypothetical protein
MSKKFRSVGQGLAAVGAIAFLIICAQEARSIPDQKRDAYLLALSEAWKLRNADM